MRQHLGKFTGKIDSMSLRERALIFAAAAFMLIALAKSLFLEPLLEEQEKLSTKVHQQQEKVKELQAQIDTSIQAKKNDANSRERVRLRQIEQQLTEDEAYLQNRRDRLVAPEKMAELLEQVLNQNGQLQLINLKTLPVAPLVVKAAIKPNEDGSTPVVDVESKDKQVFKHGVVVTVRGSYLDMLQYLTEIEKLPMQMFWGKAEMKVERYPEVELSLTVYTLSLEKTWLQI